MYGVFSHTRTGKPRKWESIFQSGKSQETLLRLWKSQGILPKILEKSGKTYIGKLEKY